MIKNNKKKLLTNDKIHKLKKYLLMISIIFFICSFFHLYYLFLNSDSKLIPIRWWTISEWLIWKFPSLNPITNSTWNNKYIINLLYRSLLKYDLDKKKIVSDIASCDISDLLYIECYIQEWNKWSNGTSITKEDILSTFKIIQNTDVNPIMSSLLFDTTIWTKKDENIITFTNIKKDTNFLNIFFQPILPKKTIDNLSEDNLNWNFSTIDQIYSWFFKIVNISSDQTIWITKIILEKNEYYKNSNILIDKYILKLFPDTNSFLKNKDTINIFNDNNNLIWDSIPRFKIFEYSLPQYVSIFINKNNIKNIELRNFIINSIDRNNLMKIIWIDNYSYVLNPYLSNIVIEKDYINNNFEKILSKLWYYKKYKLIENIIPNKKSSTYSNETKIKLENNNNDEIKSIDNITDEDIKNFNFQEKSITIVDPNYIDKYNFLTKENILIKWIADKDVEYIYINDYMLKWYKQWNNNFYYRLKKSINNIKTWENSYKIYFEKNGKKELKEEIIIIYNNNFEKLNEEKINFIKKLYLSKLSEEKKEENNKEIAKIEISNNDINKLNELDENFFYNDKLEKFKLNLFYIATDKEIQNTAIYTKNILEKIWIEINLTPTPIQELWKILNNKNDYDLILWWTNLWFFNFNIFPYFHSSQSKNWYNFSNIRKATLDIILEELKWEISSKEKIIELEKKVLDIIKKEQVVKTLYTPKIKLLVDKNIKNANFSSDNLPNKSLRSSIIFNTYIKEKKLIIYKNKWISNFLKFLLKKLNEQDNKG